MVLDSPNPIIKQILQEEGVTQTLLAYHIKISAPYMNQIATGQRTPSIPLQERIANALGKRREELGWK